MPNFTVYNTRTGEIRCTGTQATVEWCHAQAGPGESVYLGSALPGSYIRNGAPEALPERPGEHHVFDWAMHAWNDPRSLADLRTNLKAEVARRRWECEVAGLTMSDGLRVSTQREDRAALAAAVASMAQTDIEEIDFKTPDGFRRMTRAALQTVACAITLHVQRCFSAEAEHDALIDSINERSALLRYPVAHFPAVPGSPGRLV